MIVGDDDDDDNDDNLLAFIALLLFNTFVRNLLYYRFAISTTTDVDEKRVWIQLINLKEKCIHVS